MARSHQAATFTSPSKRRDPSDHTDLRDHVGDVAGVGGQQDGVGVFGKLGEGAHVLLCHGERGGGAAMLGREGRGSEVRHVPPKAHPCLLPQPTLALSSSHEGKTPHSLMLKMPRSVWEKARCHPGCGFTSPKLCLPQGTTTHLLCQSSCQELNSLRLGLGLDQHCIGFSCNRPQQNIHQNCDKTLVRSESGQYQGANQGSFTHAKPPLPHQRDGDTPATHLLSLELSPRPQ